MTYTGGHQKQQLINNIRNLNRGKYYKQKYQKRKNEINLIFRPI